MNILSFSMVYLIPVSVGLGYLMGGAYTFMTALFVFIIIPILDAVIGADAQNPDSEAEAALEKQRAYRWLTWACAPLQLAIVFWGAYVVSQGGLTLIEMIGMTVSIGVSSGILGINVAHELTHRVNERFEPLLSRIMLWTVLYNHWGQEHVVGHHRWVATPEDPATARLGESFYAFWPRTVAGTFKRAWEFKANRMRKQGKPVLSHHNTILTALLAQAVLILAVAAILGPVAMFFLIVQAVIAFSLLEVVNYIEHYGLMRRSLGDGKYGPVTPIHSWNSSNWLTNRFLFNLQRHSDHHYRPNRRYQLLRHHDESPQLPTGYAGMILLASIPPLWRRYMDPKAEAFNNSVAD